jgi:hypothetical protein
MARIKSVTCLASRALGLMIIVGLVLGPETIRTRAEEALSAAWRALGDQLANRELDAIAQQLERERQDAERIGVVRDRLSARLRSLGAFRECVITHVGEPCSAVGTDSERELASLDNAISLLTLATERADRILDGARNNLRKRGGELIALQAASDAQRMHQVLGRLVGDPSSWSIRVARARALLHSDSLPGW